MDVFDRLEIYKIALRDYKRVNNPFRKLFKDDGWKQAEHAGFCHYFYTVHKYNFRHNPLPELHEFRPKGIENTSNWFPKGKEGLKNRIKCLKKAIKNTKSKIDNNLFIELDYIIF